MSNETLITIRGYVGGDPIVFENDSGRTTAVTRVGVTARNFDRRTGAFTDGATSWYSVRSYGELSENVAKCIQKGTPVIVRGRLSPRQWTDKDGNIKNDNVIVADSLGIDLNTGCANFVKTKRTPLEPVEGEPAHAASTRGDSSVGEEILSDEFSVLPNDDEGSNEPEVAGNLAQV